MQADEQLEALVIGRPIDDDDRSPRHRHAEAELSVGSLADGRNAGEDNRPEIREEIDQIGIFPRVGILAEMPDFDAAVFGDVVVGKAEQRSRIHVRHRVQRDPGRTLLSAGVKARRNLKPIEFLPF